MAIVVALSLALATLAMGAEPAWAVGGTITTVAGDGTAGFSGDGGPATAATLSAPLNAAIDSAGNLYISDQNNHRVRRVTPAGTMSTFAGDGTGTTAGDGGPATAASLNTPEGLAFDAAGNLFVAENGGHVVRKITPAGVISTAAGNGSRSFCGDGGPATDACMNSPTDIVIDASGNLFIADGDNRRVRKVDTSGTITTFAGGSCCSDSGDGHFATGAGLSRPFGLAIDSAGRLLIAVERHRVRRIDTAGFIHTIAGTGSAGFSGDGSAAGEAELNTPFDLAFDSGGNLFISDAANNRIREVTPPIPDVFVHQRGVVADFDAENKTDVSVFRPSSGSWFDHPSGGGPDAVVGFGAAGDIPVAGDYDGDGRVDKAIFRPATGTWFIHPTGADDGDYSVSYGSSGDIPLPADFDGDGKADIAIFRPSTGLWAISYSGGGPDTFVTYGGVSGDVPVVGDYDGDTRSDIAIFRPAFGAWFMHQSSTNTDAITTFGIATDKPVPVAPAVRLVFFP